MKITCHSCGAKYTVSDEKVQGKTVKMKCRKCSATIVVGGAAQPGTEADGAHGAEDAQAADAPAGSYLVNVAEGDQRTMSLAEVVDAYNSGVITAETYVFTDGMADWQALAENEAVVAALNAAAGPASQAPASHAPAAAVPDYAASLGVQDPYQNGNGNGTAPVSSPFPAAPFPAAPFPAAAPAATPFGGGDYSAGLDSKPAAARRDTGSRKSADLFGGGYGGDAGSGGFAAASGLAASSSLSTGKREENSVLFSLNALTQASAPAAARPSSVSATTATKEDSGLIDLKALSANAPAAQASQTQLAPAPIDAMGLFPLGAPVAPPPVSATHAGYASSAIPEKKGGNKIGLIVGGVVAVAAVVGVFLLVKGGGDDKANASNKPAETSAPTASATETIIAAASATATGSVAGTSSSGGEVAAASGSNEPGASGSVSVASAKTKYTGTVSKTTAKTNTAGPAPSTAKPDGPKALPCGCKAGDVDCAIKCSMKSPKKK